MGKSVGVWLLEKLRRKRRWKLGFPRSASASAMAAVGLGLSRWRRMRFQLWIIDGVIFKIVSVFEAIVLVSALGFFYLCCGCKF